MGCFREPVIVQKGSPFWGEDLYFRRHFLLQFLVILILYVVERKWCVCGRESEDSPVAGRGARDDGKDGESGGLVRLNFEKSSDQGRSPSNET